MKEDFQDFFSNSILKFESMLKSNKFLFFDVDEFESIIIYYLESGNTSLSNKALKMALKQYPNNSSILLLTHSGSSCVICLNDIRFFIKHQNGHHQQKNYDQ